ncbi:MAG: hypothetical protein ABIF71_00020 [Planctomycetota bacterium]
MTGTAPALIETPDKDTYRKAWVTMLISATAAGICYTPVAGQFLTGYVRSMGGSEADNATISNLTAFVSFCVFFGAYLSVQAGRRFTFVTFGALRWVPWLLTLYLPFLPPAARMPAFMVLVALYGVMFHICAPPWWSLLSACVPEKLRGRFLGVRFRIVSVAGIVAMLLFSEIVDAFGIKNPTGYIIIIAIAVPIGCLDSLCHLILPDPGRHGPGDHRR